MRRRQREYCCKMVGLLAALLCLWSLTPFNQAAAEGISCRQVFTTEGDSQAEFSQLSEQLTAIGRLIEGGGLTEHKQAGLNQGPIRNQSSIRIEKFGALTVDAINLMIMPMAPSRTSRRDIAQRMTIQSGRDLLEIERDEEAISVRPVEQKTSSRSPYAGVDRRSRSRSGAPILQVEIPAALIAVFPLNQRWIGVVQTKSPSELELVDLNTSTVLSRVRLREVADRDLPTRLQVEFTYGLGIETILLSVSRQNLHFASANHEVRVPLTIAFKDVPPFDSALNW